MRCVLVLVLILVAFLVGRMVSAVYTAAELQSPHVTHHCRGVEGLPPFAFSEVLLDLSTDGLMDILAQSCVPSNPGVSESLVTGVPLRWVLLH